MTTALKIEHLKKRYANGTEALKSIDLTVQQGDFFALLGRNGAGKSTTIGIISSLVRKTSGTVEIMGVDIDQDFAKAREKMGIVAQEYNLPIFDTVKDVMYQQAGFYGLPKREAADRIKTLLKQLDLWEKRGNTIRSLSGGMKRRVMIAAAMVHKPKLLILDEPTAGVDLELRRGLYDYLEEENRKGLTIILTTHYLEEAERLCNRIAIIDHGEVILNIPKQELSKNLCKQQYRLELDEALSVGLDERFKVLNPSELEVTLKKGDSLNDVFAYLSEKQVFVSSATPVSNRLEQVFLDLTARDKDHAN